MLSIVLPMISSMWLTLAGQGAAIDVAANAIIEMQAAAKGTCTCESRAGGKRQILACRENLTYDDCRSGCYAEFAKCDAVHFETNGPTCFAIINGDADWGGQRF